MFLSISRWYQIIMLKVYLLKLVTKHSIKDLCIFVPALFSFKSSEILTRKICSNSAFRFDWTFYMNVLLILENASSCIKYLFMYIISTDDSIWVCVNQTDNDKRNMYPKSFESKPTVKIWSNNFVSDLLSIFLYTFPLYSYRYKR